jgi:DNA-directed RNA polymerase specialized sigma24 family protein
MIETTEEGSRMDLSTLMRRIQQGDREAFATLYTRYNKTVYRIALDATHDSAEAVQVVIAVFREMYQTIRSKGPYLGDLYGWLDALTAKQIRLRRVMGGASSKPASPSQTAASAPPARTSAASSARSYSQEEAAALQERALARLQRGEAPAAAAAEPMRSPVYKETERPPRKAVKKAKSVPAAIMDEEEYDEEYDEETAAEPSRAGGAFSVAILSLTALALLWVLIGLLGTLGILPQWQLGYAWFNQTLFPLF